MPDKKADYVVVEPGAPHPLGWNVPPVNDLRSALDHAVNEGAFLLQYQPIVDLARGAAVLGTGGGGDPYVGRLLAEQALRAHGPVELVSPADLPPDACVVPVAMMGAPTVMVEKTP